MNTWTDSGLAEAGLIGAKLAVGLEARLPEGPARSSRNGSRALRAVPDDSPRRTGRRRAPESAGVPVAADRGVPEFGVPAADFEGSHGYGSHASGSHSAVDVPAGAPAGLVAAATGPSSLTGSFPMTGVAKLQTPVSVPLPSEPLPPEPPASDSLSSSQPLSSQPLSSQPFSQPLSSDFGSSDLSSSLPLPSVSSSQSVSSQPVSTQPVSSARSSRSSSDEDRDRLRSSTDGFLAGGFSSSSGDSSWDIGGSDALSSGLSDSWSRPVPITPQPPIDPAVSAPTRMVRESELSPAVSAPTSLLPMPKTAGSRHRAASDDHDEDDRSGSHAARETYNVESSTLGSLDSSGLFAARPAAAAEHFGG